MSVGLDHSLMIVKGVFTNSLTDTLQAILTGIVSYNVAFGMIVNVALLLGTIKSMKISKRFGITSSYFLLLVHRKMFQ